MTWWCHGCGSQIPDGVGHACGGFARGGANLVPYPTYVPGQYTFTPTPALTADEIRKIVREELERSKNDTR